MNNGKVFDDKIDNITSGKMPYLKISCKTWFRDSYGLYDYDSTRVYESTATFYDSFHMNRDGDAIVLSKRKNDSTIVSVAYYGGSYFLCPNIVPDDYIQRMWRVVGKLKNSKQGFKGIELKRGQIIKFGRYVYKINEISTQPFNSDNKVGENTEIDIDAENATKVKVTDGARNSDEIQNDQRYRDSKDYDKFIKKNTPLHTISEEGTKDSTCRICLSEDQGEESDPLISPCKCSGTMKYIHLKCLTEWLESK